MNETNKITTEIKSNHRGSFFSVQRAINCAMNADNFLFYKSKSKEFMAVQEFLRTLLMFAIAIGGAIVILRIVAGN